MSKTLREQIAEKCIHFNGIQNGKCKVGIEYTTVRRENMFPQNGGRGTQYPCFFDVDNCSKMERPTEEYIQLRLDKIQQSTAKTMGAIKAISDHAGKYKKGEGKSAIIECPACKGRLHYSRAGYSGHIHAQCETKDCVSFMQ